MDTTRLPEKPGESGAQRLNRVEAVSVETQEHVAAMKTTVDALTKQVEQLHSVILALLTIMTINTPRERGYQVTKLRNELSAILPS